MIEDVVIFLFKVACVISAGFIFGIVVFTVLEVRRDRARSKCNFLTKR